MNEDELVSRYVPVRAGYWWKIKIGDGTMLYGKFHTKKSAEEFCFLLLREFRNGMFVAATAT